MVKLLLEDGAVIDVTDKNGRTPLSFAADHGRGTIVALLLAAGADTGVEDRNDGSPLSWVRGGHVAAGWRQTVFAQRRLPN